MRMSKAEKCNKILEFANQYYASYGKSPTVREIAKNTSISCGSVHNYLWEMVDAGIIEYNSQTILTPETRAMQFGCREVPIVGSVACGLPDQGDPFVGETMELPVSLVGMENNYCLLRAIDDSMIGAGIHEGALVLIRRQEEACAGQIILAEAEGAGITLRRYLMKNGKPILHPENPEMEDIEPDYFRIQGVATMAFKYL